MHTHTGPHMVLQECPMVAMENRTTTHTSTHIYRNTYTDTTHIQTHIQTHIHRHTDRMFNLQPARYMWKVAFKFVMVDGHVRSLPNSKVCNSKACSNTFGSAHQTQHHPRVPPHGGIIEAHAQPARGWPYYWAARVLRAWTSAHTQTQRRSVPRSVANGLGPPPPPRGRATSPPPRELPSWCYQARMSALSTDIFTKCVAQIATVPVCAPTPNPQPPGDGRIAGTPRGTTVGYFTHSTRAQPHSGWQPARA